jgi:hypothetical protein
VHPAAATSKPAQATLHERDEEDEEDEEDEDKDGNDTDKRACSLP